MRGEEHEWTAYQMDGGPVCIVRVAPTKQLLTRDEAILLVAMAYAPDLWGLEDGTIYLQRHDLQLQREDLECECQERGARSAVWGAHSYSSLVGVLGQRPEGRHSPSGE